MNRVLTPRWFAAHLATLAAVVTMLALGGWQFARATGGNALSWGYTAQWPVFAGFVGFLWWREVRRALRRGAAAAGTAPAGSGPSHPPAGPYRPGRPVITRAAARAGGGSADEDDPELAAYNRFLAWLSANPGARPVDYPG